MPKDIEICRRCGKAKPPPRNEWTCLCVECEAETSCDKFEPVLIEECHALDDAMDEAIARMVLADDTIFRVKREHRGEDWAGSVPCPTGCGGDLHLSHCSYNGHVWGRCTTEGCLNWME